MIKSGIDAKDQQVIVLGIGFSHEGKQLLLDGKMYATLFQQPVEEGYQGLYATVKYLNGEEVEEVIAVERPKVTIDNVAQYEPQW